MAKEITLQELAQGATRNTPIAEPIPAATTASNQQSAHVEKMPSKNATEVSVDQIKQKMPVTQQKEELKPSVVENAMASMYSRIEESKEYIHNTVMPIVHENAKEIAMDNELRQMETDNIGESKEDDFSEVEQDYNETDEESMEVAEYPTVINTEPETNTKVVRAEPPVVDQTVDYDKSGIDSLLEELDLDDGKEISIEGEETREEALERYKESLDEIKITSNNIDLSKFTIRKAPLSSSVVMNAIQSKNRSRKVKTFDWVLMTTGRSFTISECSGQELDALRKSVEHSNNINATIAGLKMVYEHIADGNKPTFEAWTKMIRYEDIESLYFALYMACYQDLNLLGRDCEIDEAKRKRNKPTGCGKTSIIKTPVNKMYKFKTKEAEEKFNRILQQDTTTSDISVESTLLPVSDDIAISYTNPTIYSTVIQFSAINPKLTQKYGDILNAMAYIDGFYKIDAENNELIPLTMKVYPNNLNKTVMTKLKIFIDILKTLTTDQYNVLLGKLNNIIEVSEITYVYPEDTCPECGATIPEQEIDTMLSVLFTRAQLAQIKNL